MQSKAQNKKPSCR